MKKIIRLCMLTVIGFTLCSCGGNTANKTAPVTTTAEKSEGSKTTTGAGKKILIAYFSRADENYDVGTIEKGNTELVAEKIAKDTGGTLFKIETVKDYPKSYKECTDVASKEQNEKARPELKSKIEDLADYDTVFLGYPIWWSDMPMAVYTFLEGNDFSGKTIIPFCTHGGGGPGDTPKNIAKACPGAKLLQGFDISGKTAQKDSEKMTKAVEEWLGKIKY